jgi:cation diffusion facilitator family transporter
MKVKQAMDPRQVEREKNWAAGTSVVAAVALTGLKLVVGITTGSLGILAEAAHSGLDLVAAVMTLFAVRIAARPADRCHPYGHGKVENLSALFETVLLLVTCVWIIAEAGHRLIAHTAEVEVTLWSFVVMGTSIVVDASRARVLRRAAKKHKSQALEADALHFTTDIASSSVVILGLIAILVAQRNPALAFLRYADSVAAITVALICVHLIFRLGRRTINELVDRAPEGLSDTIVAAALTVPGVIDCHDVRLRTSGPKLFVNAHVLVDGDQTLQSAHDLTDEVERAIQIAVPGADVLVHPEPAARHPDPVHRY